METDPKRKSSGLRACQITGLAGFVLCLILFMAAFRSQFVPTSPGLDRISELMDIKFPPSAKVISSYLTGPMTSMLLAKIQIRKSDVAKFLGVIKKDATADKEQAREFIEQAGNQTVKEWNPGSARNYEAFMVDEPNRRRWILVDKDRALIYLYKMAN